MTNQIHADIAANQRIVPIFLVEKSDTFDGVVSARKPSSQSNEFSETSHERSQRQ
jgi:hypothetical protein